MRDRMKLRILGAVLGVILALVGLFMGYIGVTYAWDHAIYDKEEFMSYPYDAKSIKIYFDRIESVQGNVTFVCGRVEQIGLVPKFYVFRSEGYKSISSNANWANLAVCMSNGSFCYEPVQYARAKYTENFKLNVTSPDEYYFVLLFPRDGGTGRIDVFRWREVRSPIIDLFLNIRPWAILGGAVITLISVWPERHRRRRKA